MAVSMRKTACMPRNHVGDTVAGQVISNTILQEWLKVGQIDGDKVITSWSIFCIMSLMSMLVR